jgi:hypothetical protein
MGTGLAAGIGSEAEDIEPEVIRRMDRRSIPRWSGWRYRMPWRTAGPGGDLRTVACIPRACQTEVSPAIGQGGSVRQGRLSDAFPESMIIGEPFNLPAEAV